MKLRFTDSFNGRYSELDADSQKAIDKTLDLFLRNPKAKSLRAKKIQGRKGIFEMSANMDIRITFHYEKPDTVVLRYCVHHDMPLKRP